MEHLWSPWRYRYVSTADASNNECIFCAKAASAEDRANYVVLRAQYNYILLNLYPYTNGHMLIAPYEHVSTLEQAHPETLTEMMALARRVTGALQSVYNPGGMNLGMNLGQSAGAGIAGHIHMHVLPRWPGDASFMTTVGETRVLPEDLETTYDKLRVALGCEGG